MPPDLTKSARNSQYVCGLEFGQPKLRGLVSTLPPCCRGEPML